jgi:2-polyprenyl-3-methyl-5-hydroxy-6-metoxy-1,4-benzoquinol methylase
MTRVAEFASNQTPACPACGELGTEPVGYRTAGHRLISCRACDLHFFDPMHNPGAGWYEENARCRDILEVDAVNWNHRQFLDDPRLAPGRLLDVGCGTGGFLAAAQAKGWEVAGIDFDAVAVRAARERLGVQSVEPWTLEEFIERRPGERFDAVTAFEVLEHVDEPRSFLERCFDLTQPGGHFAVSVPFRDRWPRWNEAWD